MQLDADEEGSPFFNGSGAPAATSEEAADGAETAEPAAGAADDAAEPEVSTIAESIGGTTAAEEPEHTDSRAAAVATAEAEE